MALAREPKIGDLRNYVALQSRASTAAGGTGGTSLTETYTTITSVWCEITALRGGRYIASQQLEEVATHRIVMRYRSDFTSWKYVLAGTRRFRALSVADPDNRRIWTEVMAEEMTP